ncbi:MAG: single-stranded-DNA-specific exonuclease RecJ [Desulfobulbaceae bacterium]|nr:MAG: single-stranded-DNA-specific exonuclease RecJ [Desulfobulbaceae bacterium]
MKRPVLRERAQSPEIYDRARRAGLSDCQANIVSRRQLAALTDLDSFCRPRLRQIAAPDLLAGCQVAARRLVVALENNEKIGLVTDYDVDGLTAHAVVIKAVQDHFQFYRGRVSSFVGSRLQDGYGVTEELCRKILATTPAIDLVITCDCGVSDEARLARLKEAGIDVIVTDHHLVPPDNPPVSAYAVVNPQQEQCSYPDKTIAGCMVSWLVMSAVRSLLVARGTLPAGAATLIDLLDYVALATVADSVSLLSPTNRAVVRYGLEQINAARRPCWQVLYFGRNSGKVLNEEDVAFQVSPRINGAGRMADPLIALDFLLAATTEEAQSLFVRLTELNTMRKEKEAAALAAAHALVAEKVASECVLVYDPQFHPGILGIIASRLAESHGLPAFVLGRSANPEELAGSCRSNGLVHMHDILVQVDALAQERGTACLLSYGGHQGAAGLKVDKKNLALFEELLLQAVAMAGQKQGGPHFIETDGPLAAARISLDTVNQLDDLRPYGQHFPTPRFSGEFKVRTTKYVGQNKDHLQLVLESEGTRHRAIWFGAAHKEKGETPLVGAEVTCVYELAVNHYQGTASVQLIVSDIIADQKERH